MPIHDTVIGLYVFEKGLLLVNLIAITSFYWQLALCKRDGVTPAYQLMDRLSKRYTDPWTKFYNHPTVFWLSTSDQFLILVCYFGMTVNILGLLGYSPFMAILCSTVTYSRFSSADMLSIDANNWTTLVRSTNACNHYRDELHFPHVGPVQICISFHDGISRAILVMEVIIY